MAKDGQELTCRRSSGRSRSTRIGSVLRSLCSMGESGKGNARVHHQVRDDAIQPVIGRADAKEKSETLLNTWMSWACGWTGEQVPGSCQAVRAAPGYSHRSGLRRRLAPHTSRVSGRPSDLRRSLRSPQPERRTGRGHGGRPRGSQATGRRGYPGQLPEPVCQLSHGEDRARDRPAGHGGMNLCHRQTSRNRVSGMKTRPRVHDSVAKK
jgi:hypothetical protein